MRRLFTCLLLMFTLVAVLLAQKDKASHEDTEPDDDASEGRVHVILDPGMHTKLIKCVHFRGERGSQFITAAGDHTIRVWDTSSEQTVKVIHPPGIGGLIGATVSEDGNRLAYYSRQVVDGKTQHYINVLALPDGQLVRHFRLKFPLWSYFRHTKLALSADGSRLAISAWHEPLHVYDLKDENPKLLVSVEKKGHQFAGEVAFSPDGTKVAWMSGETEGKGKGKGVGKGGIFAVKSGKELATLEGLRVAWSPSSKASLIATGGKGGVRVYDPAGKLLHNYKAKDIAIKGEDPWITSSLVFSDSGKYLLAGAHLLIDLETKAITRDHPHEKPCVARVPCSHFAPAARQFIRAGTSEEGINWVQTIDIETGQIRRQIIGKSMFAGDTIAWEPRWSKDGKKISWRTPMAAKGAPDERHSTFDLTALELIPTLAVGEGGSARVLERGGLKLVATNPEQTSWNLTKNGKVIATLGEARGKPLTYPTFVAGDGIAGLAGHSDTCIYMFDTSGKLQRRLTSGFRSKYARDILSPSPDGTMLATIRPDRALYLWNQKLEYPLLSIYKVGNDWVIWTREGYYAATPGGEKMMTLRIDNGPDKLPTVLTVDRFAKKFHRPDVIKKVFELGSVKAALLALDGKDAKVAQVEESLPPSVEVKLVKQDEATGKVTVKVTAKAQSKSQPVVALRLMLNGMPFPDLPAVKSKTEHEWTVDLTEGRHTLGALARSEDASARAEPIAVAWRKPANLPVLHVVAVGINKYATGIPALNCGVKDANDVQNAFEKVKADKKRIFSDVKTHLLTDDKATAKNITATLKEINPGRDDIAVVFLAGHGTLSKGDFFFLTADSDPDNRKLSDSNALSGKKLAELLGGLGCRTLLLLDSCHAGAADLKPASDEAARALSDDEVAVTVLSAAMGKQKALEKDGNGLFTRAITEAILDTGAKRAPRDDLGQLFVHHLFAHASDRVGALSDFKQTPFLRLADGVAPFALRQFEKKE